MSLQFTSLTAYAIRITWEPGTQSDPWRWQLVHALNQIEHWSANQGPYEILVLETSGRDLSPATIRDFVLDFEPDFSLTPRTHQIAVRYDVSSSDFSAVQEHTNLSTKEVIRLHTAGVYVVDMIGFLPGFPYLKGLPVELHIPRKSVPTRINPGSIAIAGNRCGIYPRSSPGGWHVLGHTQHVLFDPTADQPAILQPGDQVQFVNAAEI